jgi:Na+-translocating ferredoxin:NAD+ oxidoreductase RnfC subunit
MRIIYKKPDGGVAIVVPAHDLTKEEMQALAARVVPEGIPHEIVSVASIPSDRVFRDAWEHDTSARPEKIKTNMTKAKILAHDIRRVKREELMRPLDIEATIPALASKAEAKRQQIRDTDASKQTAIDAALDEAELKKLV